MNHCLVAMRHFETEKNIMDIHGYSGLDRITKAGFAQAKSIIERMKYFSWVERIFYFDTPQSEASARLLSSLSGLELAGALSLKPYNMGVASGLSNEQLKKMHPMSFHSLSKFRERIIDAREIKIPNSECLQELEENIISWWKEEGSQTKNSIIIGTNSTLTMLTNLLDGCLPSSGRYYHHHINNGAHRIWKNISRPKKCDISPIVNSWPDIGHTRIRTEEGFIQTSFHHASWGEFKGLCIICPGYFGNSRHGPYSLYSRLARKLSQDGYSVVTIDYLGSGESSVITRTFASDVYSVEKVIDHYSARDTEVLLIGHSMGASVVSKVLELRSEIQGIAIAPLISISDLSGSLLSKEEASKLIQEKIVNRRGVKITLDYCREAELVWAINSSKLSKVYLAGDDQYDLSRNCVSNYENTKIVEIPYADHNFSIENSYELLIKGVCGDACDFIKIDSESLIKRLAYEK